jgi:hypothetical protein
MSWYHAKKATRERIAANRRRYNEAPLRDELEQQAIRELSLPSLPVFNSENFKPVDIDGQRRWVLLPQFVFAVRRHKTSVGPAMYCRACGQDIPEGALRIYFRFRWFRTDEKEQTGCIHHLAYECGDNGV